MPDSFDTVAHEIAARHHLSDGWRQDALEADIAAALRAEQGRDLQTIDELSHECMDFRERIAALEAALRPFSEITSPQWYLHKEVLRAAALLREDR